MISVLRATFLRLILILFIDYHLPSSHKETSQTKAHLLAGTTDGRHDSKDFDAISTDEPRSKSEEAYFNYRFFRSSKPLGIWLLPQHSYELTEDRRQSVSFLILLVEDAGRQQNKQIQLRLTYRA